MSIIIPLTQGKSCLVSPIDADLAEYKWTYHNADYARRAVGRPRPRSVFMHRVILARMLGRALAKGEQTDHINGNGLDNRRENLRLATQQQNNWNTPMHADNRSGYKGVTWNRPHGRWQAQISVNGHHRNLGYFDTPAEASIAYERAALDAFGKWKRS